MAFWNSGKGNAKKFWDWFAKHNHQYLFLGEIDDYDEKNRLMDELLTQLHVYSKNLYFEIGGHPDDDKVELIITAEGIIDHFGKVEALVDAAPDVPQWRFVKFKQPHGPVFTTQFGDMKFDPATIAFLPLILPNKPDAVGIRVCYPEYTEETKATFINGTYSVLDTLLGEKSVAMDIDYLDVVKTPENVDEDNFMLLSTIATYIQDKKIFKYPGNRFDVIEYTDENDYLTFITANFAYRDFTFKEQFPWFLHIVLPLQEYNENGHPTNHEAAGLNTFEDSLDLAIKGRCIAHYIGRTTGYKKRALFYYVNDPEGAKAALNEVLHTPEDIVRTFDFSIEKDNAWQQVAYFLQKPPDPA